MLTVAGANRILTVDLHAPQIQGFFNIPVDELTALNVLANYFIEKKLNGNLVVVATDIGISKRARDLAERLNAPLAIMEKRRVGNADRTETLNVIGEVDGKMALTLDDEIDTAGSLVNVVNTLIETRSQRSLFLLHSSGSFRSGYPEDCLCPVKEVVVRIPFLWDRIKKWIK